MSSIKKRLFGNFGGSTYALLVTTLTQLFSIPLFLHFWGSSAYGEWLVLSAIASYLSLSDVGFSKVASNRMAMLVASNNYERARMILHSASVFLLGMS